ncbi:unnamed protein product, partial [Prorocentrum cordatum]
KPKLAREMGVRARQGPRLLNATTQSCFLVPLSWPCSEDLPYAVISPWPVGPTLQSIADPSALAHPWLPSELFAFAQSAGQQGLVDRLKRVLYVTLLPRFMALAGFHEPRRRLRAELGLAGALELLEAPVWGPRNEKPLVLVLSHWGFDRPRPLPPNLLLVGPVENYP